jgi:hypothetical protein
MYEVNAGSNYSFFAKSWTVNLEENISLVDPSQRAVSYIVVSMCFGDCSMNTCLSILPSS